MHYDNCYHFTYTFGICINTCVEMLLFIIVQILYDHQARSRSVSESASSDTTAPAGDNVTAADTSAATEDGAAAQQSAEQEVEGRYG